jgi:hypothetical protein
MAEVGIAGAGLGRGLGRCLGQGPLGGGGRWGAGRVGSYVVRRCSSQIAVPSAAAVRATKMPASIDWKIQNRSAG